MSLQVLGIQKLPGLNGLLLELIGIEGGNALLGGAVFFVLQAGFLQPVQQTVPRQQQRGPVADLQVFRCNGNALGAYVLHLRPQALTVHGHAVAQNIDHALAEDAGG
ncbi:hypothetical protein DSECCO2_248230 [anaerobic digester metagenome]